MENVRIENTRVRDRYAVSGTLMYDLMNTFITEVFDRTGVTLQIETISKPYNRNEYRFSQEFTQDNLVSMSDTFEWLNALNLLTVVSEQPVFNLPELM